VSVNTRFDGKRVISGRPGRWFGAAGAVAWLMPLVQASADCADAGENQNPEVIMNEVQGPILPDDAGSSVSSDIPTTEPPLVRPDTVVINPLNWIRRLFAANPFYLASVLLLLYGIHRVSSDTGFLRLEVQQLIFNFTAIQLYEIALVGLAIFLARKLVWYDSTLLVLLENLVVVVPFILVTQASLIEQRWVWIFCAAGVGLAGARVALLRRGFPELNLPWKLLAAGGLLLLVNATLPIIYRELQEERVARTITWGPAYHMNEWSWLAILPLLVACANLLPSPRETGPYWPQRRWLPSTLFAAWVLASGVHLYALSYVYTFELRAALWAPTLVVLAWTLQRRMKDFIPGPAAALRIALLVLPFPLAFLALCSKDTGVAMALLALNTVMYGWRAVKEDHRRLAAQLAMASCVAGLLCLPVASSVPFVADPPDRVSLLAVLLGYVFLSSLLSRRPELGLLGAIAAGVSLASITPVMDCGLHHAFHGAIMFLLLHSLRWEDSTGMAARVLRWVAAGIWVLHAFVWVAVGGPAAQLAVIGTGVCLTWLVVRWMREVRPPLAVAVGAVLVALSGPTWHALGWMMTAPSGPLAIAGSFVLLAVGTIIALTKHRWRRFSED
jgi:hypothetical protein